uniref:Putative secreted protein n=1 Tax=Ixodes ricinus TaxID=34613 RepID=A0A6B0V463_IXORI
MARVLHERFRLQWREQGVLVVVLLRVVLVQGRHGVPHHHPLGRGRSQLERVLVVRHGSGRHAAGIAVVLLRPAVLQLHLGLHLGLHLRLHLCLHLHLHLRLLVAVVRGRDHGGHGHWGGVGVRPLDQVGPLAKVWLAQVERGRALGGAVGLHKLLLQATPLGMQGEALFLGEPHLLGSLFLLQEDVVLLSPKVFVLHRLRRQVPLVQPGEGFGEDGPPGQGK